MKYMICKVSIVTTILALANLLVYASSYDSFVDYTPDNDGDIKNIANGVAGGAKNNQDVKDGLQYNDTPKSQDELNQKFNSQGASTPNIDQTQYENMNDSQRESYGKQQSGALQNQYKNYKNDYNNSAHSNGTDAELVWYVTSKERQLEANDDNLSVDNFNKLYNDINNNQSEVQALSVHHDLNTNSTTDANFSQSVGSMEMVSQMLDSTRDKRNNLLDFNSKAIYCVTGYSNAFTLYNSGSGEHEGWSRNECAGESIIDKFHNTYKNNMLCGNADSLGWHVNGITLPRVWVPSSNGFYHWKTDFSSLHIPNELMALCQLKPNEPFGNLDENVDSYDDNRVSFMWLNTTIQNSNGENITDDSFEYDVRNHNGFNFIVSKLLSGTNRNYFGNYIVSDIHTNPTSTKQIKYIVDDSHVFVVDNVRNAIFIGEPVDARQWARTHNSLSDLKEFDSSTVRVFKGKKKTCRSWFNTNIDYTNYKRGAYGLSGASSSIDLCNDGSDLKISDGAVKPYVCKLDDKRYFAPNCAGNCGDGKQCSFSPNYKYNPRRFLGVATGGQPTADEIYIMSANRVGGELSPVVYMGEHTSTRKIGTCITSRDCKTVNDKTVKTYCAFENILAKKLMVTIANSPSQSQLGLHGNFCDGVSLDQLKNINWDDTSIGDDIKQYVGDITNEMNLNAIAQKTQTKATTDINVDTQDLINNASQIQQQYGNP